MTFNAEPSAPSLKFFVETFGCQMNVADSEEMGRALLARGFSPTTDRAQADWMLVNTCTVRDHAEHRALSFLGRLREWKEGKAQRRIVVAGCAAERLKESLRTRFPHVDLVVGARAVADFDGLLRPLLPPGAREPFDAAAEQRALFAPLQGQAAGQRPERPADAWSPDLDYTTFLPPEPVTAYVTIMRGCNYACTYCIVPDVRGPELYRPVESVLSEVRQKAARGMCEVMLLGQTVNSYRPAGGPIATFADLLRSVDAVPGVRRIRYMSPHPFYVDQAFARTLAECEHVCPHIHLPVQSGSDAVLKRMRRNYTRADYLDRLAMLRRARPSLDVTTDFIVGFPGESEQDFRETLTLAEEAGVDAAFCFKYSPRPGTPAAALTDDVPSALKEERLQRALEKITALTEHKVRPLAGTRQEVLVDRSVPGGYEGRTGSFWKVSFTSAAPLRPGRIVPVKIGDVEGRSLKGIACPS